jgi:catechol 2,3-dioxygenase-like lactoylglutathione lyase family enzyme
MFAHVSIGVRDVDTSRAFYDAALAPLPDRVCPGGQRVRDHHGVEIIQPMSNSPSAGLVAGHAPVHQYLEERVRYLALGHPPR